MRMFILKSIFILFIFIISPYKTTANTGLEFYMNDFYSKSKEASLILKKIENTLKKGSREKVCSRQREAARLGLLATKSLLKAYKISGTSIPIETIKANEKRWESILNDC